MSPLCIIITVVLAFFVGLLVGYVFGRRIIP